MSPQVNSVLRGLIKIGVLTAIVVGGFYVLDWARLGDPIGQQKRSKNTLRQLGLALNAYHDRHERFPAAVMYGPDGKTPYSWRVALLAFMDEEEREIYGQYRFDEPWDSEHNSRLIEKIPSVYRHVLDERPAGNTGYFAIVGDETLFPPGGHIRIQGWNYSGLADVIAFVDARRDVPWTKPEDILYDAEKPLPKFGGFHKRLFQAVNGDSSVESHFDFTDNELRDCITISDDELVAISAIRVHGQESAEATTALRDGDGCCADPDIESDASRIREAQKERLSELLDSVLKTKSVDQADGE